mgnify:CR=1 FL=1
MTHNFFQSFILLLLVTDPFGNVPLFVSALRRVEPHRRAKVILRECAIAFIILLLFMLFGRYFMQALQLSEISLRIGGGVILFLIAALGLGLPTALYAMLTYFVATRSIDYVIEGLEEYTGVTIISKNHDAIKKGLVMKMGKGISVYKGERGFMKESFDVSHPTDIIFTVVTRFEVRHLRSLVLALDPNAFIFTNTIKEAAGGVLLKRKGEH